MMMTKLNQYGLFASVCVLVCVAAPPICLSFSDVNKAEIEDAALSDPLSSSKEAAKRRRNKSCLALLSFTLITLKGIKTPLRTNKPPLILPKKKKK